MTPEERATAIGAQFPVNGIQYTYLGIVFAVSNCVVTGPTVWVTVSAWTGTGKNRVYLPVDDRYGFTNPPLMVPDGGTQVITDPRGNPITVKTYTRSDLAAAQQMVYDAVTGYARAHGWVP
jgi:hypothetical protein